MDGGRVLMLAGRLTHLQLLWTQLYLLIFCACRRVPPHRAPFPGRLVFRRGKRAERCAIHCCELGNFSLSLALRRLRLGQRAKEGQRELVRDAFRFAKYGVRLGAWWGQTHCARWNGLSKCVVAHASPHQVHPLGHRRPSGVPQPRMSGGRS